MTPSDLTSSLPWVDDLLDAINAQTAADSFNEQAGRDIANLARKLSDSLRIMIDKTIGLHGGHLSTERILELQDMLDREIAERQALLGRLAKQ